MHTTSSRIIAFVWFVLLVLFAQSIAAQTATSPTLSSTGGGENNSLFADFTDAKTQADILNKAKAAFEVSNLLPAWLKPLNIQFKTFQPTDSDKNAALGFEYSYEKAVTNLQVIGGENRGFLSFDIKARGNVSFDRDNDPADFLQTGVQLGLWQLIEKHTAKLPPDQVSLNREFARKFAASGKTWTEIRKTPEGKQFIQSLLARNPADFFYDAAANVSLESNQSFSKKQLAYGAQVYAAYRVWDPESVVSRFNILDWPFAVTRMLGGDEFQPQGRYLPGVMLGIDLIDPLSNTDRFKIDPDKSAYPRLKAEIGFRSKVVELNNQIIWFNAGYRFFQEIGASSAIKNADMDVQHYFAASLDLLFNVSVTYSIGKLPFDLKDQQVWALGYNVKF